MVESSSNSGIDRPSVMCDRSDPINGIVSADLPLQSGRKKFMLPSVNALPASINLAKAKALFLRPWARTSRVRRSETRLAMSSRSVMQRPEFFVKGARPNSRR